MPAVALLILVALVGCGATLFVASRAKTQATPRRRRSRRRRIETDPADTYSTWQFADWAGRDAVIVSAASSDDRPSDDNACRVESDTSSSFDVERDDSCSDSSDSSDSASDSGDSGSSD